MTVALATAVVWPALLIPFKSTQLGESVDFTVGKRIPFMVRAATGHSPEIDTRLKIFAYDDVAVAWHQDPELSLSTWADVIGYIGSQQPSRIILDKVFGFVPLHDRVAVPRFRAALQKAGNVGAGVFTNRKKLAGREPLDLSSPGFDLSKMTGDDLSAAEFLPIETRFAFGPHAAIAGAFSYLGHVAHDEQARMPALVRVGVEAAIPALPLTVAKEMIIRDGSLFVDGTKVPTINGDIVANLPELEEFFKRTKNMRSLFSGKKMAIKPGDVVLVLPRYFTGNSDTVETPFGRAPAGYLQAAVINSILQKSWIVPFGGETPAIIVMALFGVLFGLFLGPRRFWQVTVGTLTAGIVVSIALFVFASLLLPWMYPAIAFFAAALTSHAYTSKRLALESARVQQALQGAIPQARLKEVLSGGTQLQREASERVVTVMFIDIANFSIIAEKFQPKVVFDTLRSALRDLTKIIHKYEGTIDKTLGDGMLCFFGYSYDGKTQDNQADVAIDCAIEMQKHFLDLAARHGGDASVPVFALRIGVNTGAVFVGDIGNEERMDFTIIGTGVNYAQRLEAACDNFLIMISGTTLGLASRYRMPRVGFKQRLIKIKHHADLFEAIECDPSTDAPALRRDAIEKMRENLNISRLEQRWLAAKPEVIRVATDFGDAVVVDFSTTGLCIDLPRYLSKGVQLTLRFVPSEERQLERLRVAMADVAQVQVMWGRPAGNAFRHGVLLTSLSDEQQRLLFACLRDATNAKELPLPPQKAPAA